jgi:hypothetical protein
MTLFKMAGQRQHSASFSGSPTLLNFCFQNLNPNCITRVGFPLCLSADEALGFNSAFRLSGRTITVGVWKN